MFGKIIIWLLLIFFGYLIADRVWSHRLNPLKIGVIVWAPGIIFATIPREFLSSYYYHLNHLIGYRIYIALTLGYIGFMFGMIMALAVLGRGSPRTLQVGRRLQVNDFRLFILYLTGFFTFGYLYSQSGLSNMIELDHEEIYESRLNLHNGAISFLTFLMDICGIVFYILWQESGKKIYLAPYVVAVLSQMATLQKSRTLLLVLGAVYASMLNPTQAKIRLFGSRYRAALSIGSVTLCVTALFLMNSIRGIGAKQMTTFNSALFEQIYIYSGGTAILNLSSTIEGHSQSDEPRNGLILLRPITWHIVDRDLLFANKYLEGINSGTYLLYGWADFRWPGFLVTSFMTGLIVTSYILMSMRNTVHGIVFGIVALEAVVFCVNTDVIFDPTTPIILFFGLFVSFVARDDVSKQTKQSV